MKHKKTPEKHPKTQATQGESEEKNYGDLEEQIKAAEEDAKKHYDKLLRVMAEFENFKKRTHKETSERIQYGNEKVLNDLLPILDDLDRVIDHIPETASEDVQNIAHGVELVRKNMLATLEKHGLSEIPAFGQPFDPNLHEAISTDNDPEINADTITTVHRKGYKLNDRLLRAAMVTVNK